MKKILIVLLIITLVTASVVVVYLLYLYNSTPSKDNPNSHLSSINYVVQIGYNIIYLILAVSVLLIAESQLNKTREATTIQTLSNIDYHLRSDDFLRKRKKFAQLISINGVKKIQDHLNHLKNCSVLNDNDSKSIAIIKNIFEDVIYQFEFIAYYHSKNIFSIEDVYQLFSIEIQQYWLLVTDLGFIGYLRNNNHNPIQDYYDKFEDLFHDTIKQEIKNNHRFYVFYSCKRRNRLALSLIEEKRKVVAQFLIEEKNLIC